MVQCLSGIWSSLIWKNFVKVVWFKALPNFCYCSSPGVDPTKLFFFANEEFFRFLLVSLHFRYIQTKNIDSKMTCQRNGLSDN